MPEGPQIRRRRRRTRELDRLAARQQALLAELGDVEEAGIVFHTDGTPTDETLAVASALTAQVSSELDEGTPATSCALQKAEPARQRQPERVCTQSGGLGSVGPGAISTRRRSRSRSWRMAKGSRSKRARTA